MISLFKLKLNFSESKRKVWITGIHHNFVEFNLDYIHF